MVDTDAGSIGVIQVEIETSVQKVLVAGCGYVGTPLAARLAADGLQVWGLRRSVEPLPAGVCPLRADLTRPLESAGFPSGLDAVVYCLARGRGEPSQGYRQVFVEAQQRLMDRVARTSPGLRRWLFVSSTAVYEEHHGGWVDETSPTNPGSEAGQVMLEAEAVARAAPGRSVVVRFSGIYGPGRSRLVRGLREGSLPAHEGPDRWLNQIHRDDCVGVLRHVLHGPEPAALVVASDEEPALRSVVLAWLARRMGVAPPEPDGSRATGPRSEGRGSKRVTSARLRASGYRFRFPTYREGYEQVLSAGAA